MSVSIIIVNWNAGSMLADCISSLEGIVCRGDAECVIVDNGSTDGSALQFEGRAPAIRVIKAGENLGFAAACNLGARSSHGRRLLFLNPDTRIGVESFDKSNDFLDRQGNEQIGILGIQLRDDSGDVARSCARFPGVASMLFHSMGIDRVLPSTGFMMEDWRHDETRLVDHVIGAYYLVRREVFDAVGGFDERFFLYLEDLDFSLRARRAGWLTAYLAGVSAFHLGGGTSARVKARRLFYSLRSRLLYSRFHLGFGFFPVFLASVLVEPCVRLAHALVQGSSATATETISAYRMLWRWLPRWWFRGETRWNP
jgi:GT2 family glycosyltransferase